MRLPHLIIGILALTVVAGCESDEKKLERLQGEEFTTRMLAEHYQTALQQIVAPTLEQRQAIAAALRDSLATMATRHTLAERALNQFMAGR